MKINHDKTKQLLYDATNIRADLAKIESRLELLKDPSCHLVVRCGSGLELTDYLDGRTKTIIQQIIIPDLEAEHKRLENMLVEIMKGGIQYD